MIRLNCFFEAKEGNTERAVALCKELVAASLEDSGCKGYDLFTSATRPNVMMFCETWLTESDLAAHMASQHFGHLVPAIEELTVNGLKLERMTL